MHTRIRIHIYIQIFHETLRRAKSAERLETAIPLNVDTPTYTYTYMHVNICITGDFWETEERLQIAAFTVCARFLYFHACRCLSMHEARVSTTRALIA